MKLKSLCSFRQTAILVPFRTTMMEEAKALDREFPVFRDEFSIPTGVYLTGNSLGAQPKLAAEYVASEMEKWATHAVEGHFTSPRAWAEIHDEPTDLLVPIVGAKSSNEVAVLGSLSTNLHLLFCSFYQPVFVSSESSPRFKVMMEAQAFCSDHHVVRSQIEFQLAQSRRVLSAVAPDALGKFPQSVEECLVLLEPRPQETCLHTTDIIDAIDRNASDIALILLPGVQFYTGQAFEIGKITQHVRSKHPNIVIGWDLAHAVGNIPLELHNWHVDFAAWCSYKYLNSGPGELMRYCSSLTSITGSISGLFVHEQHHHRPESELPRLKGWFGQALANRFRMAPDHMASIGAQSWIHSNPAVLPTVCLTASLKVFQKANLSELRRKSVALTGFLERLVLDNFGSPAADGLSITIITPKDPQQRGCQLSLLFNKPVRRYAERLLAKGCCCDVREPDVLRVSPTPLYNTFTDVASFVHLLLEVCEEFAKN